MTLRHGEGLAGPGDPEQHLRLIASVQALDELIDRPRLIPQQREIGDQLELIVLGRHGDLKSVPQVGIRGSDAGRARCRQAEATA